MWYENQNDIKEWGYHSHPVPVDSISPLVSYTSFQCFVIQISVYINIYFFLFPFLTQKEAHHIHCIPSCILFISFNIPWRSFHIGGVALAIRIFHPLPRPPPQVLWVKGRLFCRLRSGWHSWLKTDLKAIYILCERLGNEGACFSHLLALRKDLGESLNSDLLPIEVQGRSGCHLSNVIVEEVSVLSGGCER